MLDAAAAPASSRPSASASSTPRSRSSRPMASAAPTHRPDRRSRRAVEAEPALLFPPQGGASRRRLQRTLDMWLEPLRELDDRSDPRQALDRLYRAQARLFAQPSGRLAAVRHGDPPGAPHLDGALSGTLRDLVEAKTRTIKGWIAAGAMRPVDPKHLIFSIWATTQHYADFDVRSAPSPARASPTGNSTMRRGGCSPRSSSTAR